MSLPTIYDLSTPTSNLAALMGLGESIVPAILSENRIMTGADLVPALFAGAHGYRRSHSFLQTILWGIAGYMAPFPVVAVAAFENATGNRAFGTHLGDFDATPKKTRGKNKRVTQTESEASAILRQGHRFCKTVRGKRKRVCKKYAS
jgi:hypothetical protein